MSAAIRAAVVLLTAAAAFSAAAELTLQQAMTRALERNPSIAAADARTDAAKAQQREAQSGRLPRLEASETVTRGNNPVFVFGSLLEQGRFAPRHFDPVFLNDPPALTNHRAALTARYALFDRFRTAVAVRQAGNGVERAALDLEETRQWLRAEVVTRFYGAVVAAEKVKVAEEALRSAEADARATQDRFARGLLVESDALSSDVAVASFRQKLISAEGELAIARASLSTLLGQPLTEPLDLEATLPPLPGTTALDDAIARATANRVTARTRTLDVSDASLQLRAERAAMLPRVDLFGTLGASGDQPAGRSSDYTGALVVTLDVFDPQRSARVAAAKAGLALARAGEASTRDAITMEVVAAWHRLRAATDRAAVAAIAVRQAESAARIVRDRYEMGLTTITEQLRTQTALNSARLDSLTARYESVAARTELLRATGELDDSPFD